MNMCFNMRQNVRLLNVQSEAEYRHQSEDPPPDMDMYLRLQSKIGLFLNKTDKK